MEIQMVDMHLIGLLEYFRPPIIPVIITDNGKCYSTLKKDFVDKSDYPEHEVIPVSKSNITSIGMYAGLDKKNKTIAIYKYIYDRPKSKAYWYLWGKVSLDRNSIEQYCIYEYYESFDYADIQRISIKAINVTCGEMVGLVMKDKYLLMEDDMKIMQEASLIPVVTLFKFMQKNSLKLN